MRGVSMNTHFFIMILPFVVASLGGLAVFCGAIPMLRDKPTQPQPEQIIESAKSPTELIVGKWLDLSGSGYTIEFSPDGKYNEIKSSGNQYFGTYTISENGMKIEIKGDSGSSSSGPFVVDENRLNLFGLTRFKRVAPEGDITISFASSANQQVVSSYSLTVLQDILKQAKLDSAKISRTASTPEDQARIMFENIQNLGVDNQKKLYGPYGDQVIDVYVEAKRLGKSSEEIKKTMTEKIYELGPPNVSKHLADPTKINVIDIAPSSIKDRLAFEKAVKSDQRVSKFLTPSNNDPAYHLEIPQPK